jgi:NAD(P)-dependent dehydrogenase (short-subunit alcohol dehydrogenase family)
MEFNDKVAVITGAASGVGKALSNRLAKAGAKIVLSDIEQGPLDKAVAEINDGGGHAIGVVCDVSKRDQVDALRDEAFAKWGKVHAVFNNAGVGGGGGPSIWTSPEKSFRWAMDVNFFGPLNGVLSFLPRMFEQNEGGLMAATSSGAGIVFPPNSPAYSASKSALIALMEILQFQLDMVQSDIKAAILFPGPHVVDTNLFGSHRNLQKDYDDPIIRAGGGIDDMETFQTVMKSFIGREVETTDPKDFAEEVYTSLLRDDFYILPLTDMTKDAVRKRFDDMLERRHPVVPQMF